MFESFTTYVEQHPSVVAAVSAALATLVAFISVLLSLYGLYVQRRHNRASVLPIAVIGYWDYQREIVVRVRNGGVGPLKVKAISIKSITTGDVTSTVIEQIRNRGHNFSYSHFSGNIRGKVLTPGGQITLLKLTGDLKDTDFAERRDAVRRVLSDLNVRVTYQDIYGRTIGTEERDLAWFGRHFADYDMETRAIKEAQVIDDDVPASEVK